MGGYYGILLVGIVDMAEGVIHVETRPPFKVTL